MRQRNQRYSRKNQKKSYNAGFVAGYEGTSERKPAGLNSRIYKQGREEGDAGKQHDLDMWDFLKEGGIK